MYYCIRACVSDDICSFWSALATVLDYSELNIVLLHIKYACIYF